MIEINIICAGVHGMKEDYFRAAESEYLKRISRYAKVTVTEVGESDKDILTAVEKKKRFFTVALAVGGKEFSSATFASFLEEAANRSYPGINFIIGSSLGFGKPVEDRADLLMSFSKMTFPHRMMRVILEEQIYRGFNILSGGKYDK